YFHDSPKSFISLTLRILVFSQTNFHLCTPFLLNLFLLSLQLLDHSHGFLKSVDCPLQPGHRNLKTYDCQCKPHEKIDATSLFYLHQIIALPQDDETEDACHSAAHAMTGQ